MEDAYDALRRELSNHSVDPSAYPGLTRADPLTLLTLLEDVLDIRGTAGSAPLRVDRLFDRLQSALSYDPFISAAEFVSVDSLGDLKLYMVCDVLKLKRAANDHDDVSLHQRARPRKKKISGGQNSSPSLESKVVSRVVMQAPTSEDDMSEEGKRSNRSSVAGSDLADPSAEAVLAALSQLLPALQSLSTLPSRLDALEEKLKQHRRQSDRRLAAMESIMRAQLERDSNKSYSPQKAGRRRRRSVESAASSESSPSINNNNRGVDRSPTKLPVVRAAASYSEDATPMSGHSLDAVLGTPPKSRALKARTLRSELSRSYSG